VDILCQAKPLHKFSLAGIISGFTLHNYQEIKEHTKTRRETEWKFEFTTKIALNSWPSANGDPQTLITLSECH
jgi:hypothetical protein